MQFLAPLRFLRFRSQKSDPRAVPEMYRTVITKTCRFHDFPSVWAPEPFRSQTSDPRGVPGMYRIVLKQKTIHDFLPVWAPDPFRSQKSDARGVPEMYRILITKTYRFHHFPSDWARNISEPKIGSERGARNGASAAAGATF